MRTLVILDCTMNLPSAIAALDEAVAAGRFIRYLAHPIPHALDMCPQRVVDSYLIADASDKELVQIWSRTSLNVLAAYAERLATLAVRGKSEVDVERSLVALGLAISASDDLRDEMLVMPLPWHAAKLLGLDAVATFERAAKHLSPVGRDFLIGFSQRAPENQTLECMGYVVSADNSGFRYQRTW